MDLSDAINQLCLACGLCCNGVLFRDVELQAGDDVKALERFGFHIRRSRTVRCAQPCVALGPNNECAVYARRPRRCRDFQCGVLRGVATGELPLDAAHKLIRRALRHANRITTLLRQLGDHEEHLPLARRFRRLRRRMESSRDEKMVDLFAELTLEVHHLNVLTHSRFYTQKVDTV